MNEIDEQNPQAVAINLLFSFINDHNEREIEAYIEKSFPERFFISRSSAVLPEYQEYERGIATWLNACISPVLQHYLKRLQKRIPRATVRVMQSDGHTISADKAGDYAVRLLLSGPAGGVIAMDAIGEAIGHRQLLGFDMGGTSTDVSLIDEHIGLTRDGHIGHYPVSIPMIDIHTIGAGGGSIAYLDAGGLLRVGPQSAGAVPGPACYGRGGKHPTVTDANLILGRLPASLGNRAIRLDRVAAEQALSSVAQPLNMDISRCAHGIIDVVNEHMVQALKVMSVHKGKDLARFLLIGFGAAGGLHVCALADGLRIKQALVPAHAGILSALGMLLAPQGMVASHAFHATTDETATEELNRCFEEITRTVQNNLTAQGATSTLTTRQVDLRYRGQAQHLRLDARPPDQLTQTFHRAHEEQYGYRLDMPVEIVSLHVTIAGEPALSIAEWRDLAGDAPPITEPVIGPAVITTNNHTVYVAEHWQARCDELNNIILTRAPETSAGAQ